MEGPLALQEIVEQLEGFEAPAAAWEKEILGVRLNGYKSGWLDDACRSGRTTWVRLRTGNGRSNGAHAAPAPSNRRRSPCCRAGMSPCGGRSRTRTRRPR